MILGFSEHFDKAKTQPTFFREKILAGVYKEPPEGWYNKKDFFVPKDGLDFFRQQMVTGLKPKLHTIREGHRWRAGMSIQMAYGYRTKNYKQFNKGIPELEVCKSVQKIEIVYGDTFGPFKAVLVVVDGKILEEQDRIKLAINDGFDSLDKFFQWFNRDFEGQIIHFTDLRY